VGSRSLLHKAHPSWMHAPRERYYGLRPSFKEKTFRGCRSFSGWVSNSACSWPRIPCKNQCLMCVLTLMEGRSDG
jgi:hypothetical protein